MKVTRIKMLFTSTEDGSTIVGRCREVKSDEGRKRSNAGKRCNVRGRLIVDGDRVGEVS